MISGANDEELDIANIRADLLLEIKTKEVVEYLQHHIPKIIKYEDGSWCNCDVKLENDTLVIIPDYKRLFDD